MRHESKKGTFGHQSKFVIGSLTGEEGPALGGWEAGIMRGGKMTGTIVGAHDEMGNSVRRGRKKIQASHCAEPQNIEGKKAPPAKRERNKTSAEGVPDKGGDEKTSGKEKKHPGRRLIFKNTVLGFQQRKGSAF